MTNVDRGSRRVEGQASLDGLQPGVAAGLKLVRFVRNDGNVQIRLLNQLRDDLTIDVGQAVIDELSPLPVKCHRSVESLQVVTDDAGDHRSVEARQHLLAGAVAPASGGAGVGKD